MARPIKETPILSGKDASQFVQNMKASEGGRVSKDERKTIREAYAKIQKLAKF